MLLQDLMKATLEKLGIQLTLECLPGNHFRERQLRCCFSDDGAVKLLLDDVDVSTPRMWSLLKELLAFRVDFDSVE